MDTASSVGTSPRVSSSSAAPRQFTSFRVGEEIYAIDIMSVREIKGWSKTTPLPDQPPYVLGVLNLRGAIVPVYDLRCRFGLGLTQTSPAHVVMIVQVEDKPAGILVDSVSDILTVTSDTIKPVPEINRTAAADYVTGIIAGRDGMVVVLSLDRLFGDAGGAPSTPPLQ